jgi:hypothetical protein
MLLEGHSRAPRFARRARDLIACSGFSPTRRKMNQHKVVAKLNQFVEHAQLRLQDPKSLTSERQSVAGAAPKA